MIGLKQRIIIFLFFILISIFLPHSVNAIDVRLCGFDCKKSDFANAKQIKFEVEGHGFSVSEGMPIEVQKQEAFVAAFFSGISRIAERLAELKETTIVEGKLVKDKEGKMVHDKIFVAFRERVGEFNVDSQSILVDAELKDYIINVEYSNQKVILKMLKMISPPLEFFEFPMWNTSPKKIFGIDLKDVQWEWDKDDKNWFCTVLLSYLYDKTKIEKGKKEKIIAKNLDFEFQRDNSNNYVFETIKITGSAYGGGADTPDAIRKRALEAALRNAVEKVNGVFIQSLTEVENAQLIKDEIISQTLGIANVIDKKFNPRFTSEGNYEVSCTVTAKVPILRIVIK